MRKLIGIVLVLAFLFYVATLAQPLFEGAMPTGLTSVGAELIERAPAESGSANVVTAVVVQFRGLDTLGEVTVLFVSALGVAILAAALRDNAFREMFADDGGFILQTGSRVLLPFILLVGVAIVLHGHLTPGGGFPGGVIIATAVLVVLFTGGAGQMPHRLLSILEGGAGLAFVGLGITGLSAPARSFLANTLPLGEFGTLFSAGLIPVIYAVIAIKVASELSNVISGLTGEESHA